MPRRMSPPPNPTMAEGAKDAWSRVAAQRSEVLEGKRRELAEVMDHHDDLVCLRHFL